MVRLVSVCAKRMSEDRDFGGSECLAYSLRIPSAAIMPETAGKEWRLNPKKANVFFVSLVPGPWLLARHLADNYGSPARTINININLPSCSCSCYSQGCHSLLFDPFSRSYFQEFLYLNQLGPSSLCFLELWQFGLSNHGFIRIALQYYQVLQEVVYGTEF